VTSQQRPASSGQQTAPLPAGSRLLALRISASAYLDNPDRKAAMTYDYDQDTTDGEQHVATASQLEQSGFTIHAAPTHPDSTDETNDPFEGLFDGGLELETREGTERALRAAREDLEHEHA
jgi:hypothetical protein